MRMHLFSRYLRRVTIGVAVGIAVAAPASAATFVVDSTLDSAVLTACTAAPDDCSLRGAITAANNATSDDIVQVPAGTYVLTGAASDGDNLTGDLNLIKHIGGYGSLSIQGAGATSTIISGSADDRIFKVVGGLTVTISGLTIADGATGGAVRGGGMQITASSNVTLDDVIVRDNYAGGGASGDGGALFVDSTSTLTVRSSWIYSNTADSTGGAIYAESGSTLNIRQSSISNNTAGSHGGGIYSEATTDITDSTIHANQADGGGGGIFVYTGTTSTLTNVTVDNNDANHDGAGVETGGAFSVEGTLALRNAIVLDNVVNGVAEGCSRDLGGGTFTAGGRNYYDFVGATCTWGASDIFDSAASAGTYGGFGSAFTSGALITPISLGSPAVNAGDASLCGRSSDQRGASRTIGSSCDIGAMELGGFQNVGITLTSPAAAVLVGASATVTGTWSNSSSTDPALLPTFSIPVPTGTTITGAVSGGTCATSGSTLTCSRDNLNTGESVAITLTIGTSTAGTKSLVATTSAGGTDANTANNTASASVTVNALPTATLPDSGKKLKVKKGKFSFRVGCPTNVAGSSCNMTLNFVTKKKIGGKKQKFSCTTKAVAAATTRSVSCKIPTKVLRKLKAAKAVVSVNASVSSTATGGGAAKVTTAAFKLKF